LSQDSFKKLYAYDFKVTNKSLSKAPFKFLNPHIELRVFSIALCIYLLILEF